MVSDISKIQAYDETRLRTFENELGISVKSRDLLKSAITSPKAHEKVLEYNLDITLEPIERLAYLGDSILYFVASEHVISKYNNETLIGKLHNEREKYKQGNNLAKILIKNQLLEYFWIEENYHFGSIKWTELMGTFFEAIIGALYLDQCKLDSAKSFVNNYIISNIDQIIEKGSFDG